MKKYFLFLVVAAIATTLSLTSCSQDDDVKVPTDKGVVKFSSNITDLNPALRAAGNSWDKDDAIGVYMLESETSTVVGGMANVEYTTSTNGTSGTFTAKGAAIYFPLNGDQVRFMSYYPHNGDVTTNGNVYSVNVATQSDQSKIDLLYAFKEDDIFDITTTGPVSLAFEHQLTKVIINVKAGNGLTPEDLQNLKVHFNGLNTQADFDLFTGTLGTPEVTANIIPATTSAADGFVASYEAIILPMATAPEGSKIVFDLNGEEDADEYKIFTWNFVGGLESATKYIYNVTINRTGVELSATIKDWIGGETPTEIIAD